MIHPNMRVSELLQQHPDLLETLIAASPAFEKLRNPLLRRTMPRLVSLAQAARIGGLEPEALLDRLNQAIGCQEATPQTPNQPESKLDLPIPPWIFAPLGFALDVRPILQAGGEPFQNIMAAAGEVHVGQRLVLDTPFEPLPLYKVMTKKGFEAWCERWDEAYFRTHFYRRAQADDVASEPLATHLEWDNPDSTLQIEAHWEPPLPMQRILEALAELQPGQRLLVHHVRRPVHLLARLEQDQMSYELRDLGPNHVDLLIQTP